MSDDQSDRGAGRRGLRGLRDRMRGASPTQAGGPAPAVEPAKPASAATSAPVAKPAATRPAETPVAPARESAGWLRARVLASPRLTAGLGRQWTLTDAGQECDVVLVEVDAASGAAEPTAEQRDAVTGANSPVVVWVTASGAVQEGASVVTGLLDGVTDAHVVVDDETAVEAWAQALGRPARHLGPAVDPAVHSIALTGSSLRRERQLAIVGDPDFDRGRLPRIDPDLVSVIGSPDAPDAPRGDRPELGRHRTVAFVGDEPLAPWYALEAASAGASLLATDEVAGRWSEGVARYAHRFDDDTRLEQHAIAQMWQDELHDRATHAAAREVRASATFAHRAADLEALLERPRAVRRGSTGDRGVSAVISTNRAHELDTVADNMARQTLLVDEGAVQVVLVLHGLDVRPEEVAARFRNKGIEHLEIRQADPSLTLGACLNLGIDASDGAHIAKVDDDNYYGRWYLADLVDALDHSGAGIVGKWAHYMWLRSTGAVILRFAKNEHSFERLVQGGSILMRGDVARELRFSDLPRRVDTTLLDRAREAGIRTYSADRFNYVSIRGHDPLAHTWQLEDTAFMNRSGRVVFYGDPRAHVEV
ncbi:hypothetical protein ACTHQ1_13350 [Janibacter anophelis]|uniref:hypothetical protein n=1 Tax=Janibacter anophelis TaxID=319054 RepID=UPI003F7F53ED